jgi:hypothetical protein
MARQRAKVAWLREGDANTSFFHQHAAYRRQKNVSHSLQVDGATISDHAAMAKATFTHFEGLLGTSVDRMHPLDLDFPGTHSEDLSELEAALTEEEIWEVIRRLPSGKAPGPDGFTNEFFLQGSGQGRFHGSLRQVVHDVWARIPRPKLGSHDPAA